MSIKSLHYKNLLQKHHLRPLKYLGQHFLINRKVLQKIIQTADLSKNDTVLEIGPGLGILTKELAKKSGQVIAIEKDKRMKEILKETLKDYQNIKILEGDILKSQISNLKSQNYKLVANLPYYITSPIIRMFLESKNPPREMVLLVQKEVAQRICANPPKMNLLAVSVQFYSEPKIISYVSHKSFWPRPKVDSAIIKITPNTANIDAGYRKKFFKIVKAGFSAPRKQLINNLSKGLKIDKPRTISQKVRGKEQIKKTLLDCGLNLKARPGDLSVKDWINLIRILSD